jgi:ribosomal protein S1
MKVYLNNTLDLYQGFSTNEVIGAFVSEKVEGGFKININGIDVFAHSLLDLNIGDYIKLKIVEASPSKMVLKLIQQDINELDQALQHHLLLKIKKPWIWLKKPWI